MPGTRRYGSGDLLGVPQDAMPVALAQTTAHEVGPTEDEMRKDGTRLAMEKGLPNLARAFGEPDVWKEVDRALSHPDMRASDCTGFLQAYLRKYHRGGEAVGAYVAQRYQRTLFAKLDLSGARSNTPPDRRAQNTEVQGYARQWLRGYRAGLERIGLPLPQTVGLKPVPIQVILDSWEEGIKRSVLADWSKADILAGNLVHSLARGPYVEVWRAVRLLLSHRVDRLTVKVMEEHGVLAPVTFAAYVTGRVLAWVWEVTAGEILMGEGKGEPLFLWLSLIGDAGCAVLGDSADERGEVYFWVFQPPAVVGRIPTVPLRRPTPSRGGR